MAKTTEKTFSFLRKVKNGMVSDTFYFIENHETFIMNDFLKSSAEKAMIMNRKKALIFAFSTVTLIVLSA